MTERQAVEEYMASNSADSVLVREIQEFEAVPGKMVEPSDSEKKALFERALGVREQGVVSPMKSWSRWAVGVGGLSLTTAVAIALAVPAGRTWLDSLGQIHNSPRSQDYVTRRAQLANITLPDGSRLILGPDTRARYTSAGSGERVVDIDGHAYFTVDHVPGKPFIVRSRGLTTRVLGTSFTVRSYATDRTVQIAVAEGRVAVEAGHPSVVLSAGDVGNAISGGAVKITHDAKIADVLGWTRGHLTMKDVTLQEAAYEIERQYDIDIAIPDTAIAARRLTIAFTGQSLSDLLGAVADVIEVDYRQSGKLVTFTSRRGR